MSKTNLNKNHRYKKIFRVDSLAMISAFRYALGRRTYIVGHTVKMILENWDKFAEEDKKLMVKEILQHKDTFGDIGSKYDELEWNLIIEKKYQEYKKFKEHEKN
jgi:hypothetical protein